MIKEGEPVNIPPLYFEVANTAWNPTFLEQKNDFP
jgi:hypothetical protein